MKYKFLLQRGSALLVSILVMTVLISVSMIMSTLLFREINISTSVFDAGKSFYAAESAAEVALYKVRSNLPGWEPEPNIDEEFTALKIDDDLDAVAEYSVSNRCSASPCLDENYNTISLGENLRPLYGVLEQNESVTIPLFVVDENGQEIPVGDFVVQYFVTFNPSIDFIPNASSLPSVDVLRWKIFGLKDYSGDIVSESIGDFVPAYALRDNSAPEGKISPSNYTNPSWFGTVNCNNLQEQSGENRYSSLIRCNPYSFQEGERVAIGDNVAERYIGQCFGTQASEFYDLGPDRELDREDIQNCYSIQKFVKEHELNYLTLTNLVNPGLFKERGQREKFRIYYRVEFFRNNADFGKETGGVSSADFTRIEANGYAGDSKKTVEVELKKGEALPIFNFSLYATRGSERDENIE